uniref:Uncharacterized protein n=3 Tax=unclassified bacterial viruses TaxID=12333 RepID=A0AAU8KVU9_9VIRU
MNKCLYSPYVSLLDVSSLILSVRIVNYVN